MPQKKTTRKISSKTLRKTNTNRKTHRTTKRKKVFIPTYKITGILAFIVTVCIGLVVIKKLSTPKPAILSEQQVAAPPATPEVTSATDSKTTPELHPTPAPSHNSENANEPVRSSVSVDTSSSTAVNVSAPQPSVAPQNDVAASEAKPKYNFPKAKNNAQLTFVFDDGGQNLSHLAPFLKLPFPITVAVLPRLPHSAEAASQIRKAGFEVMLHQPMQAVNAAVNPGPGAIKPEMTEEEIKTTLFQNVTEVGPIAGMNNHEGSAITADAEKMATVMQFCSQEGIYFLDSRTNVETKVPYVAGELGYSWYERNIFLDNEKTTANALKELKKGLDLANKNGSVIMIGHIWSADFLPAFLQDVYPELKAQGYTFSTVSKSHARKN